MSPIGQALVIFVLLAMLACAVIFVWLTIAYLRLPEKRRRITPKEQEEAFLYSVLMGLGGIFTHRR
jgi:hypothetical protein